MFGVMSIVCLLDQLRTDLPIPHPPHSAFHIQKPHTIKHNPGHLGAHKQGTLSKDVHRQLNGRDASWKGHPLSLSCHFLAPSTYLGQQGRSTESLVASQVSPLGLIRPSTWFSARSPPPCSRSCRSQDALHLRWCDPLSPSLCGRGQRSTRLLTQSSLWPRVQTK